MSSMANEELIELCRTVIGAIQESDSFDTQQLRRLIIHIVPSLLAEIDILSNALDSLLQNREVEVQAVREQKRRKRRRRRR